MDIRTGDTLFGRVLLLIPSDTCPDGFVLLSYVCVTMLVSFVSIYYVGVDFYYVYVILQINMNLILHSTSA